MSDSSQKTEKPTAKKLREARAKGQFARAEEIGVVFVLMATFSVLLFLAADRAKSIKELAAYIFIHLRDYDLNFTETNFLFKKYIGIGLQLLFPLLTGCTIAAILAGGIQSGFRLSTKALEPSLSKLNPQEGLKKLFSAKKLIDTGFDILKCIAVGIGIYYAFLTIYNDPIFNTPIPLQRIPLVFFSILLKILSKFIFIFGSIAGLKYVYERYNTGKKLMMSKQELKEELKQSMVNPQIKMAQTKLAKSFLQKQMLDEVPTADVIITNPTHYAVALKYERGKDVAPIILAKGDNLIAKRIKKIGAEHEVPTVENKPAARMLFSIGKVGSPIPIEVYEVVAAILSTVYKEHKYYFHQLKLRRLQKKPGRRPWKE